MNNITDKVTYYGVTMAEAYYNCMADCKNYSDEVRGYEVIGSRKLSTAIKVNREVYGEPIAEAWEFEIVLHYK